MNIFSPKKSTICHLGALLSVTLISNSSADTPNTAVLNNHLPDNYIIYTVPTPGGSPDQLVATTDTNQLINALQGDITNAGGNVELYFKSDSDSLAAFKNATNVTLQLDFGMGNNVTLSSLNGHNWFDTASGGGYNESFGVNNLANQWFNDFVAEMNLNFPTLDPYLDTPAERENLFNSFRDNGGFKRLSDPNISYVETSNGIVTVGLGGFIDVHHQVTALIAAATGSVPNNIPAGIQISEVVLIDGKAHYGFKATDSGVELGDTPNSYTGNYVVQTSNVPEPSSTLLIGIGGLALLFRKRS